MLQFFRKIFAQLFNRLVPQVAKPVGQFTEAYLEVYANHMLFHLFTLINEAYKIKSKGGRDRFGIQWPDLKPATKEARFPRPVPGRVRGNLTKEQDKLWRQTFARLHNHLESKGVHDAGKVAAGYAWKVVKAAGAVTRLQLYGRRQVELLRVSGRLSQSVAPGTLRSGKYTPDSQDQVAKVLPKGGWQIGSKVPYFAKQNLSRIIIPLEGTPAFDKLLNLASERAAVSAAKEMQRKQHA